MPSTIPRTPSWAEKQIQCFHVQYKIDNGFPYPDYSLKIKNLPIKKCYDYLRAWETTCASADVFRGSDISIREVDLIRDRISAIVFFEKLPTDFCIDV